MDLIYANEAMEDVGVLLEYVFDLAIGSDENNFELTVDNNNHVCHAGYYLYIEGSEYGGVVDTINVKTASREIIYKGRTWQGLLASKILEPDSGQDYLILSGEANELIAFLVERMKISEIFLASTEDSGLMIQEYKINRYINGYEGIMKMLLSVDGKLDFIHRGSKVILAAKHLTDYSKNEQFDSDQVEMEIERGYSPINHVICLGQGELASREVVHVYADKYGIVGNKQSLTGIKEVAAVYENVNAASQEELAQGGINLIKEAHAGTSKIRSTFNNESFAYDIGDIVGAKENITGIEAAAKITKKIVTINKGIINVEYKVGD